MVRGIRRNTLSEHLPADKVAEYVAVLEEWKASPPASPLARVNSPPDFFDPSRQPA